MPLPPSAFNVPVVGSGRAPGLFKNVVPPRPTPQLNWTTNAIPPRPPSAFNPDPGAMLTRPLTNLTLFTNEFPVRPLFQGEPIPDTLVPPRTNVRNLEIKFVQPTITNDDSAPTLPQEARLNRHLERKWENPGTSVANEGSEYPPFTQVEPNRWRIGFLPWQRYTSGDIETPYETPEPMLWHPYKQSILKGDAPLIGQDIFLNLTASTETEFEARRIPLASGVSSASPEVFGISEQLFVQNYLSFAVDLFKGEAAFKPVDWAIRLQPVFNVNYTGTRENGVINLKPVTDEFIALQQAFLEVHLRDLSDNYDFVAARFGNQPFNSDFRGFIFNDINLGARFFGNYSNNRWQYNLAVFDMREKDSNSQLNSFASRDQVVLVANVYRQDCIWDGYTAELSFLANLDHGGGTNYDDNGNLVRPEPLGGPIKPHDVNAYYFGWAGDGHIGRLNLSHAFYEVIGHDELNGLAGHAVDINAQMAALELSLDRDWIRYKASLFYASGDGNAKDGKAHGFDTILDNPNFTGGPFSWYVHQGFNLAGTEVNLKQRNSLVLDMRSSKIDGQANFVNPGVLLAGIGAELELTPKLSSFININHVNFVETDPIKTALLTDKVDNEFGWDFSIGFQYRPLLTDNVVLSAGFGALLPGSGFRDIYNPAGSGGHVDNFLYSILVAVTLTY